MTTRMTAAVTADAVTAARFQFFSQQIIPEALVSKTILQSWMRCTELGLDASRAPVYETLDEQQLNETREKHQMLRRLCRGEMDALRQEAQTTGGIVVLTDPTGMVLDSDGDMEFAGKAASMALRAGVMWSEARIGTNAVGTALVERRPIMVHGGEHFCDPHRVLSCAAAPIFNPTGEIVGALDLTSHASVMSRHALSLVRLVIDQIEHRQFDSAFDDLDVLRFHADPAHLGTARECILVFEGDQLVAANRHGLKTIAQSWEALRDIRFTDIFAHKPNALHDTDSLQFHSGEVVQCRPRVRDTVIPATNILNPPKKLLGTETTAARGPIPWPKPAFDTETLVNIDNAAQLIDADIPLLIIGETGSGKEAFARAVHAVSSRTDKPFIAVNCAALPESLIESELFGYEDGAFTGARRHGAKGLLREADGGILFLDEIGDMPFALQSRLLRVLQDRQIMPLGGRRAIPVDIRIISATHRDIAEQSHSGQFRPDLYYRIAQFTIALNPLRTRTDKPRLVDQLWQEVACEAGRLPIEMRDRLAAYDWPGNYRELVSTLRALAALCAPGKPPMLQCLPLALRALPGPVLSAPPMSSEPGLLEHHTHDVMRTALDACGGNMSMAARKLGINRSTLYRHLQRIGQVQ